MNTYNYLFIGGGNMAQAIMQGMQIKQQGLIPQSYTYNNYIVERNVHLHQKLLSINTNINAKEEVKIFECVQDVKLFISKIDCIILAIKPQDAKFIMQQLQSILNAHTIKQQLCIISIMAGVSLQTIQQYLPYACIRSMPNTPLLVSMGATALVANNAVQAMHKSMAENIFNACGSSLWLEDEAHLHTVTALSGGGPAYVFYILQAMQNYAIQHNLPADIARQLISQTFKGAAHMALVGTDSLISMQNAVTSKGGTTEQAIAYFNLHSIDQHLQNALQQAHKRSEDMQKEIV